MHTGVAFSAHTGMDGATDRSSHHAIFILEYHDRIIILPHLPIGLAVAAIASTASGMRGAITVTAGSTITMIAHMTILDFFD